MSKKRPEGAPEPRRRVRTDAPVFKKDCVIRKTADRPIVDTYYYIVARIPEDTWGNLSYRKRVCMQFLLWYTHPNDMELMCKLVEMVKAWRKNDKRVGGNRTLLERMVRSRLFKKYRHYKLTEDKKRPERHEGLLRAVRHAIATKTGAHSPELHTPEFLAKAREKALLTPQGLDWIVTSPWGDIYHVKGLRKFCAEHGLHPSHLANTARYQDTYHKGWKARKKAPDWPV